MNHVEYQHEDANYRNLAAGIAGNRIHAAPAETTQSFDPVLPTGGLPTGDTPGAETGKGPNASRKEKRAAKQQQQLAAAATEGKDKAGKGKGKGDGKSAPATQPKRTDDWGKSAAGVFPDHNRVVRSRLISVCVCVVIKKTRSLRLLGLDVNKHVKLILF